MLSSSTIETTPCPHYNTLMQIGELAERLETAQRAVAKGDTNIQDQRDLVARLKEAGVDAGEARQELDSLLKHQTVRHQNLANIMRLFPPEH
jgi:hypothetical protein